MLKYKCSICGREKRIHSSKYKGVKFSYTPKKDKNHFCDFSEEIYRR